ncbi:D-beta-D-heptose 7-phosphate kinase [Thiomonas arsenitoxydans]|uniref:ADP-heptose synthase n=1 Tax=Thiomonas arsenitoxydans (strain DSM 22701 / CIP 110005 / 3As) TaxID=426114 RepID=D6CPQ2_THIA3|nr:D-glycero-beta-D-manno-heptose-7-phosphate kinase [Thiomonas arsenitoxydans]CAZ87982.1 putative ADP-heptose synthase [Thiomonas arsenitoxydans]CQR26484.1 D-beta-D-heptose 7-phosphate kinase [Thiomonas arsenitoxydans]CQR27155.1 D-beta-D-heptose 7-phosphate kinase [Thiomonas arsenitoxydans]CQR31607.1 D-beta-D-heptose 7-phosphate kinase [Thiomonas arsenitoxydans]CQR31623.1 D-beta-D-heptose 7-phosphate kinase [Thiomonas arsenitoxydans]
MNAEQLAQSRVLIVGDVMLDRYWFGSTDRISPEAPVPVVRVQRDEDRVGGAANVALNASVLGAQATLLSVVGADEPGRKLVTLLVDTPIRNAMRQDPTLKTTVKLRVVSRQQQLIRLDFEHKPDHEVLAAMMERYEQELAFHDVVLLSDYGKGGLEHLDQMMNLARTQGKTILVDPKGRDYSRYAGATLLTPNRAELAQVVGDWSSEQDLTARAQGLRKKLSLKALLLTRSEEGMSLYTETGELHIPTEAKEVYDVSGAGDTVIATVAVMLGAGLSMEDAVRTANRAAGIVVGKLGTASVTPKELWGTT